METQCAWQPCLLVKGQGCMITFLILLCTVGNCQPNSQSADSLTLTTAATAGAASITLPVQTSLPRHVSADATSLVTAADVSSPAFSSCCGEERISPYQHNAFVETSAFVSPSVMFYSTAYFTADTTSLTPSEAKLTIGFTESSQAGESLEIYSSSWFSPSQGVPFKTTAFLDSVALSTLQDFAEELVSEVPSGVLPSSSTPLDLGAVTPEASMSHSDEAGGFEQVAATPTWSHFDDSASDLAALSEWDLVATSSIFLPASSSTSDMFDMNLTQASVSYSSAGETTLSVFNSSPVASVPSVTVGRNASCVDKDSGCVPFGTDEGEGESVRVTVIVGFACGAILLVVFLGVFIGCVLRRRSKMPSGSKIDLSSYWDDSVTLSYINGHVDIPKDSADEMISLDNDSFLNSLDSMSFTNTWTSDTSRHTNF